MVLPEHIHLEIVTPDKKLFSGEVEGRDPSRKHGISGILPGHAPLLAELGIGEISYRIGNETQFLFCSWGFVEVLPDRVIVLAQTAESASEIDINRAEQAKTRAERLLASKDSNMDFARAQLALLRALTRLEIARRRHAVRGSDR